MLLTQHDNPVPTRSVGRRKINDQEMTARFPAGTLERIRDVLRPKGGKVRFAEKTSDFVREAVIRELERREALRERRTRKDERAG